MVLAIDIGGTNTEFGVVDYSTDIVFFEQIKTKNHHSFSSYITNFKSIVKRLSTQYDIEAIGIGAPNYDSESKSFCPVNFKWNDVSTVSLKNILENEVNIPTFVVNDANAIALAENSYGIGRRVSSFLMITIGTGLGSGIVINNDLYNGPYGYAGEFGHTKVDDINRQCNCGGIGCLETVVSANGIKFSLAQKMNLKNMDEVPVVRQIFERANQGDAECQEVLEYTFKVLGKKLSDAIHFLTPEAVVFGGNISKSLHKYLPIVEQECEKHLMVNMRGRTIFHISDLLDKKMNILGPASLAIKKARVKNHIF